MDKFDCGLIFGILIGEGHFGGDGKQPQVTVRMHSRHRALFEWLLKKIPGSKLYGPYYHDGRDYLQWMVRGAPLRECLIPMLDNFPWDVLDGHTYERYQNMKERYNIKNDNSGV